MRENSYLCSLASTAVAETTEDLACLTRAEFECHGRLSLKAGDGTTQF